MTRRMFLAAPAALLLGQDWVSLFDGKTAKGWTEITGRPFPENCWAIEDGCLKSLQVKPTFQDIRTEQEFEAFRFEWEWKIAPKGNSGVKYLLEKVDRWQPKGAETFHARARGPEYQLMDDAAVTDDKQKSGALYGKIAPAEHTARAAGEWNQSAIVVAGGKAEHWLNGQRVVSYEIELRRSPIALQNHQSEAWFRNLRVKIL